MIKDYSIWKEGHNNNVEISAKDIQIDIGYDDYQIVHSERHMFDCLYDWGHKAVILESETDSWSEGENHFLVTLDGDDIKFQELYLIYIDSPTEDEEDYYCYNLGFQFVNQEDKR